MDIKYGVHRPLQLKQPNALVRPCLDTPRELFAFVPLEGQFPDSLPYDTNLSTPLRSRFAATPSSSWRARASHLGWRGPTKLLCGQEGLEGLA
jgi:hypothetical protein